VLDHEDGRWKGAGEPRNQRPERSHAAERGAYNQDVVERADGIPPEEEEGRISKKYAKRLVRKSQSERGSALPALLGGDPRTTRARSRHGQL